VFKVGSLLWNKMLHWTSLQLLQPK